MKTISVYFLFYVLTALLISACDNQTSKATTPSAGVVKVICECNSTQNESPSLIQGQGASFLEATINAVEKCKASASSQYLSVTNCENQNPT